MRISKGAAALAAIIGVGTLVAQQAMAQPAPGGTTPPPGGGAPQTAPMPLAWAPKKNPYQSYEAPNKAHWKLADVKAMHAGEKNWTQPIIRNKDLAGDWHQMTAGGKTTEAMFADNRVAIIVWEGQLRVTLDGQEPFVATKGFEIDVPFRRAFKLENIGTAPAMWFEIHQADDAPIYPVSSTTTKPADIPGYTYARAFLGGGQGVWDDVNKPYLDYFKDVVNGSTRATAFIASDHMFVNNIRGKGVPTPPPTNLGHYHIGYTESWFIMEGNVDYQIEGVPFFTAAAGDIVTAAQGRWHRASFGGPVGQMDTRVAINPFPRGLHTYSEASGGRQ
jgi:mannose-6-phosphate isomerase-like protein (cupin superfamily)